MDSECCANGCSNSLGDPNRSDLKFFDFPSEEMQERAWIAAISTVNGTSWVPTEKTLICSEHFVGNQQSDEPDSLSYCPTVFNARNKKLIAQKSGNNIVGAGSSKLALNKLIGKKDFNVQTFLGETNDGFNFECTFNPDGVSTQANILVETDVTVEAKVEGAILTSKTVKPFCLNGFHGYSTVKNMESAQIWSLTGMTHKTFTLLIRMIEAAEDAQTPNPEVDFANKILIFAMKLKCCLTFTALAVLFKLDVTSTRDIFLWVLKALNRTVVNIVFWPSRTAIDSVMPTLFRNEFPKCRVILYCAEITVEMPEDVEKAEILYSLDQCDCTIRFIVGITPSGFISFVSKSWSGNTSYTTIAHECGVLDLLEPGDMILTDKEIPDIFDMTEMMVVTPPFMEELDLVEPCDAEQIWFPVYKYIQRLKDFQIMDRVPSNLLTRIDDLIYICAAIVNLQPPVKRIQ